MAELRFVVDTEQPVQLKSFLRGRNGVSARLLVKLKHREGGITCNGEPVRTIDTVAPGDVIVLDVGESRTAEPNPELFARVVFENESLAVFDKPAGMPVHESYWHHGLLPSVPKSRQNVITWYISVRLELPPTSTFSASSSSMEASSSSGPTARPRLKSSSRLVTSWLRT